jgi:hypothetical protein
LPVGASANLADLRTTFETKRRKLAATLLVRDLLETGAGLLVTGVFVFAWWKIGAAAWPMAFAIALVLGVSGFFVRERFRARRVRVGVAAPLLAKVEADIAELQHQRHLLRTVWAWYLGPLAGAIAIVAATLMRVLVAKAPPGFLTALWDHPAALVWIVFYFAVVLPVCFWGVWALNRRAVRKGIEPRLAELEKLHGDLLAGE